MTFSWFYRVFCWYYCCDQNAISDSSVFSVLSFRIVHSSCPMNNSSIPVGLWVTSAKASERFNFTAAVTFSNLSKCSSPFYNRGFIAKVLKSFMCCFCCFLLNDR